MPDVLVIGGGFAGLNAALNSADQAGQNGGDAASGAKISGHRASRRAPDVSIATTPPQQVRSRPSSRGEAAPNRLSRRESPTTLPSEMCSSRPSQAPPGRKMSSTGTSGLGGVVGAAAETPRGPAGVAAAKLATDSVERASFQ